MKACLLACGVSLFTVGGAVSQSLVEGTLSIQQRADGAVDRFRDALAQTARNPAPLTDGTLAASVEQALADLAGLDKEVDSQLDHLAQKEAALASSGLGVSDRKELATALAAQKKPLADLKSKNARWRQILESFQKETIDSWREIHSSFAEVEGGDKALVRLSAKIEEFTALLPSPTVPRPASTPAPTPALQNAKPLAEASSLGTSAQNIASSVKPPNNTDEAAEVVLPEIVAKVNGTSILRSQLEDVFNAAVRSSGTKAGELSSQQKLAGYNQLLNDLVDRQILLDASGSQSITDADVDAEIARFKSQFPNEAVFKEQMEQADMTFEKLREDVSEELRIRSFMQSRINEPEISESDVKSFYRENPTEFQRPETVKASHILFMVESDAPADVVKQKEEAARDAVARARKGEDFAALAKELSDEPGATESGGDLGYFPEDRMVPEFAKAAFAQELNEVGDPVRTQFGWHVIKVTDKKVAGTVPFDEVRDQIAEYLKTTGQREATQSVLKNLKESAEVEIFLPQAD
jgi:peptidyl-prolyl cis-trans isomerase C